MKYIYVAEHEKETLVLKDKITQEELARKLGKSRSAVATTIRVLNLEPRVLEFAKQGKLKRG